ncbi:MAG: SurA N-terminal domain-containing protein, partial [Eggerthellaceae bacterium]|nr:SurA N-terminal domain-containing protein [Eggerthellaceae bacterium]
TTEGDESIQIEEDMPSTDNDESVYMNSALVDVSEDIETAAIINNEYAVSESAITQIIEEQRELLGLENDEDWAEYLEEIGSDPESVRQEQIDKVVRSVIITEAANEAGVTMTDDEVQQAYDELQEESGGQEAFEEQLASLGLSSSTYKDIYAEYLLEKKLADVIFPLSNYEGTDSEKEAAQDQAFEQWYVGELGNYSIETYEMPEGLSYSLE